MIISQIVAVSQNGVIGKNNRLPWHIPADLAHFKKLTMNKTLLMGKNTYLSLPKKLEGRRIIVISQTLKTNDVEVCPNIETALQLVEKENEIFIAGGERLYKATMDITDKIYLTYIKANFTGDSFYPLSHLTNFRLIDNRQYVENYKYEFKIYLNNSYNE